MEAGAFGRDQWGWSDIRRRRDGYGMAWRKERDQAQREDMPNVTGIAYGLRSCSTTTRSMSTYAILSSGTKSSRRRSRRLPET